MDGYEKIAIFVDGPSLHSTARALGFDIDFKRLLTEFEKRGTLLRSYFFSTISESAEFSSIRPLIDWLDYNGFAVRTKPAKEYDDGEGRRKLKRNMGVEIAVDVLEIARYVDHIFLFSGDGDLQPIIQAAQRHGVRVTIVSSIRTKPPMISDDLRRQADHFLEVDELRGVIARQPFPIAPE